MDDNRMIQHTAITDGPITVHCTSAKIAMHGIDLKNKLVAHLLQDADSPLPPGKSPQLYENDTFGCPRLLSRHPWPMAISFSYQGQELWAAAAKAQSLGVDVENPQNFSSPYPFTRVFSDDEFRYVAGYCYGREDAAALLWSCKEAAVKNLGTGFHYCDPREVRICSCLAKWPSAYKLFVRTPVETIDVFATRRQHLWLAIAVSQ
jgi:phosphopantetheinyl transferase